MKNDPSPSRQESPSSFSFATQAARPDGRFEAFVPLHYESGYEYPLLVWLRDAAARQRQLSRSMRDLSLRNHLALAVDLPEESWGHGSDRLLSDVIDHAIDRMSRRANVHLGRVFIIAEQNDISPVFDALHSLQHSIAGLVNLRQDASLPPLPRRAPENKPPSSLLFCLPEPHENEMEAIARAWRLYHAYGFSPRLKTSAPGKNYRQTALRNVDRWILEQITGQPSLDPKPEFEPSVCLN